MTFFVTHGVERTCGSTKFNTIMKKQESLVFESVPSVNFHLWQPCNMRCHFCFATFHDVKKDLLPKGHLPRHEAIRVVEALCHYGFQKITFVGGEPTLCPWLIDLIQIARAKGLTTMLVTNGSRLNDEYLRKLRPVLDWLCLSIDSLDPDINILSGRVQNGGFVFDEETYTQLILKIRAHGFRFKINSVVHRLNCNENISVFINRVRPERWKVFRALPVDGQNNGIRNELLISSDEFGKYVDEHRKNGCNPIAEDNEVMQGSYAMVDPAGRFFDSSNGFHVYSKPILEVGVKNAYLEVSISKDRFHQRGGNYDWS